MLNNTKEFSALKHYEALSNEIELIVCTIDKKGMAVPTETVNRYIESIETFFSETFGGATTIQGIGSWVDENGLLTKENNFIIQASASDENFTNANIQKTMNYAALMRYGLNQDKISMKINGSRYFI